MEYESHKQSECSSSDLFTTYQHDGVYSILSNGKGII